jgi:hypothetical protein
MEGYSPHFTGFSGLEDRFLEQQESLYGADAGPSEEPVDLSALIEQSLTPLSVGDIINTMNHNNMYQQQNTSSTINTTLNNLNTYQLLSGNVNNMPVIIVNIPGLVSPPTPSAEMSSATLQEPVAGNEYTYEEPPHKKRRPSVVEENDMDIMALSHQMDLLRRNSLPVLHSIHVTQRQRALQPSVSVDELLSPSKLIRDDYDLLDEFGSEIIPRADENDQEEEKEDGRSDSPPFTGRPFDFGNFFMPPPPAKNEQPNQLQPAIQLNNAPVPLKTQNITELPQKQRRRKSTPAGETPTSSPGTPVEGADRKLVCLGKRPRKNKKTQPEDQFLMKFTMRRNK